MALGQDLAQNQFVKRRCSLVLAMQVPMTMRMTSPISIVQFGWLTLAMLILSTQRLQKCQIMIGVKKILRGGCLTSHLGWRPSINIPCINAFEDFCADNGPLHIVQIDAHLDFVDERHGVTVGHGNPMRRAAEKHYIKGLSSLEFVTYLLQQKKAMKMLGHLVQIFYRCVK